MSRGHVIVLKLARSRIESHNSHYVCDALRLPNMNCHGEYFCFYGKQIKKQIDADLGGKHSLQYWLADKGIEDNNYSDKMRATRLAWIDAMIEYWRDK